MPLSRAAAAGRESQRQARGPYASLSPKFFPLEGKLRDIIIWFTGKVKLGQLAKTGGLCFPAPAPTGCSRSLLYRLGDADLEKFIRPVRLLRPQVLPAHQRYKNWGPTMSRSGKSE